jgi:molybdopterin-guanine dinucleotide biosynthesis protein B
VGVPLVSIIGNSESGKTTLIEKLIQELNKRGYKVATIKHAEEIDCGSGKDSDRHLKAGSELTAVVTPDRIVLITPTEQSATIDQARRFIDSNFDIILCEGYKHADAPKIEVHIQNKRPLLEGINNLVAIVTNEPLDSRVRQFSFTDITAIADFLENDYIQAESLELYVNGVSIPLSLFPRQVIGEAVTAMAFCLKGVTSIRHLEIKLRKAIDKTRGSLHEND